MIIGPSLAARDSRSPATWRRRPAAQATRALSDAARAGSETVWMHVRAPHGRVAFGLGRLRAAGPAGSTVVSPTTSTVALLLGGGSCCWGRRLLLGEEVASHCCRWRSTAGIVVAVCCRGGCRLDASGWRVARPPQRRRWPRSESVSPGLGALRG